MSSDCADGGWRLGVHIADVSHYVRPGNALDHEARKRGNSTYLADRVIPMLPERLSNGICSLKPGVERLTMSAFIDFDDGGQNRRRAAVSTPHGSSAAPRRLDVQARPLTPITRQSASRRDAVRSSHAGTARRA